MYWQEEKKHDRYLVPDEVVDVAFQIACRSLPVDHAWALSQAVLAVLPWIEDEPGAGVHTIHVADSGNGWMRPEGPDDLLYLSRRTKLLVRVPRERIGDAQALVGRTLNVAGHALAIEQATLKPLSALTTIFARYVVTALGQDENRFLGIMLDELQGLGIRPKKMLCGIEKTLATPAGPVHARSLMIAELSQPESVAVQQRGLGPLRHLGCGLFLPHKDIKEVRQAQGE
jgi:CRISPR-associated protein Cas6